MRTAQRTYSCAEVPGHRKTAADLTDDSETDARRLTRAATRAPTRLECAMGRLSVRLECPRLPGPPAELCQSAREFPAFAVRRLCLCVSLSCSGVVTEPVSHPVITAVSGVRH